MWSKKKTSFYYGMLLEVFTCLSNIWGTITDKPKLEQDLSTTTYHLELNCSYR